VGCIVTALCRDDTVHAYAFFFFWLSEEARNWWRPVQRYIVTMYATAHTRKPQSLQNAGERRITGTRRCDHITRQQLAFASCSATTKSHARTSSGTGIYSWWHLPCRRQQPSPTPISSRQSHVYTQ